MPSMLPLMRAEMKLPVALLLVGTAASIAAIGIVHAATDSPNYISSIVLVFAIGAIAAINLFATWRLANQIVRTVQVDIARQVGGAIAIQGIASRYHLSPLGDSALSPAAAGRLLALIHEHRPGTIVELGAGSSTRLLAEAVRECNLDTTVHSVEHDALFVQMLKRQLDNESAVRIHFCPLTTNTAGLHWYDLSGSDMPRDIELLIVDGPPDVQGKGNRSLAMANLYPRLADQALILVDDADRRAERAMVTAWLSAYDDLQLYLEGRDHVVLARNLAPDASAGFL